MTKGVRVFISIFFIGLLFSISSLSAFDGDDTSWEFQDFPQVQSPWPLVQESVTAYRKGLFFNKGKNAGLLNRNKITELAFNLDMLTNGQAVRIEINREALQLINRGLEILKDKRSVDIINNHLSISDRKKLKVRLDSIQSNVDDKARKSGSKKRCLASLSAITSRVKASVKGGIHGQN